MDARQNVRLCEQQLGFLSKGSVELRMQTFEGKYIIQHAQDKSWSMLGAEEMYGLERTSDVLADIRDKKARRKVIIDEGRNTLLCFERGGTEMWLGDYNSKEEQADREERRTRKAKQVRRVRVQTVQDPYADVLRRVKAKKAQDPYVDF